MESEILHTEGKEGCHSLSCATSPSDVSRISAVWLRLSSLLKKTVFKKFCVQFPLLHYFFIISSGFASRKWLCGSWFLRANPCESLGIPWRVCFPASRVSYVVGKEERVIKSCASREGSTQTCALCLLLPNTVMVWGRSFVLQVAVRPLIQSIQSTNRSSSISCLRSDRDRKYICSTYVSYMTPLAISESFVL